MFQVVPRFARAVALITVSDLDTLGCWLGHNRTSDRTGDCAIKRRRLASRADNDMVLPVINTGSA